MIHCTYVCTLKGTKLLADLWSVTGLPNVLFPTKEAAEVAARRAFPNEDPHRRYARISYSTFTCKR